MRRRVRRQAAGRLAELASHAGQASAALEVQRHGDVHEPLAEVALGGRSLAPQILEQLVRLEAALLAEQRQALGEPRILRYAGTPIRSTRATRFSAILMDAASISLPSSETAPLPSAAACSIASRMRRAYSTSASLGENTSFARAICEGWIAHLPSHPSCAARRAAAV